MMNFRPSRQLATKMRIEETPPRRGTFSGKRVAQSATAPAPEPDLEEAADLYYRRPPKALAYRHFDSAAVALGFIRDNLNAQQVASAVLQVGERRFEGEAVAAMLRRLEAQTARAKLDA